VKFKLLILRGLNSWERPIQSKVRSVPSNWSHLNKAVVAYTITAIFLMQGCSPVHKSQLINRNKLITTFYLLLK